MSTAKPNIVGNGLQKSSGILPKENRLDLSKLEIVTEIGKAKSIYVRLDHYLKAVTALEFAENQVRGLEVIISEGRDISQYQNGIYFAVPPDDPRRKMDDQLHS
jgi:hypothetical protein